MNVKSTFSSATINGLTKKATYYFRVKAVNKSGTSDAATYSKGVVMP